MSKPEPATQTHSCLIVEDSVFDQRMMMRMLKKTDRDFAVEVVSTLEDARRALADHPVSIILLDNTLPDGKGANFALELSKHEEWRDIPVLIVSDWPSPFMWQKAQLAGVQGVVTKAEFGPRQILDALPKSEPVH